VAQIDRRQFLSIVPGAVLAAPVRTRAQARPSIVGLWTGSVSGDEAMVRVLSATSGTSVTLTMTGAAGETVEMTEMTSADGVATFALTGLTPRTRYRFGVAAPGEAPVPGAFRTFGDAAFSFRVVFASCASTGSASAVFTAMRGLEPDLFIHMGDLHYENIARNDVARFRKAYTKVLASPTQSALFRAVPLAYTWDDHDYGPNNSDRTSPSRPAALRAYRQFVPHYPLADEAEATIHQAFTVGRVRFLLTDARSARSPHLIPELERTMLGQAQLAWLERELEAAQSAALVVLVNTVPWITKRKESTSDGWAKYARERRHIADLIVKHGLTDRLIMLSGDAHMLALDDGTHSQYSTLPEAPPRGFVVAHAAPMDRRPTKKGGPYTHPEVTQNGQFGVMDVRDEGGPIAVTLQGMRGAMKVPGMELNLRVAPTTPPTTIGV
jgi:alkaline phosphatase D